MRPNKRYRWRRISVFDFGPGTFVLEPPYQHGLKPEKRPETAGSTHLGKSPEPPG